MSLRQVRTWALFGASLLSTVGLVGLGGPAPVQAATARSATASSSNVKLTVWPAVLRPALKVLQTVKPSTAPLEGPTWMPTYTARGP